MTRKRTSENDLVVSSGAAAPVRRKAAARPRAKRAAEPVESLAPAASAQDAVALQADAAIALTPYMPTSEEIAALAYSYWEARGCQGGCPEEDWLRAEEELRSRSASAAIA
jgi:hypothetical protein